MIFRFITDDDHNLQNLENYWGAIAPSVPTGLHLIQQYEKKMKKNIATTIKQHVFLTEV